MQIEGWPVIRRTGRYRGEQGAELKRRTRRQTDVEMAHCVAEEFRNGTPNGDLWVTPVTELATRGWELVAKGSGEKILTHTLRVLQKGGVRVSVPPLEELAEIFPGVSYDRSVTISHDDDPSGVAGLVRASDVSQAGVRPPSFFLTKGGNSRVESRHRLRAGDILLTASGAVGKPAVVSGSAGIAGCRG